MSGLVSVEQHIVTASPGEIASLRARSNFEEPGRQISPIMQLATAVKPDGESERPHSASTSVKATLPDTPLDDLAHFLEVRGRHRDACHFVLANLLTVGAGDRQRPP